MQHRSLAALILINLAILAAVLVASFSPRPAQAQFGAANMYTMISGGATGRAQQAAVYVINLRTAQVVPFMFNTANNRLDIFAGRNLGEDSRRPLRAR